MRLYAVVAPGLEEVVAREVARLPGAAEVAVTTGGVSFSGDDEVLYRANLWLRAATRVLVRVGEVRARDFERLKKGAAALPWAAYGGTPRVSATAHRSRLYHTGAIAERVEGAIGPGSGPEQHVFVRGEDDVFTFSVDSSGELLHRRGYREEGAAAPLRETLAAGLLELCGWTGGVPLVDPMCGSGTIVLEAALLAAGRAPGARREFAFQSWPSFRADLWARLLAEAGGGAPAVEVRGFDADAGAVAAARRNAERAGLGVSLEVSDVREVKLPAGPGLVVANPPYGRRLAARGALPPLYASLGRLARGAGWRLAVLAPSERLARAAGRWSGEFPLLNGGLRVGLYVYE